MATPQAVEAPKVAQTVDLEAPTLTTAGPVAEGTTDQYPPIPHVGIQQAPQQQQQQPAANYYQQQAPPGKPEYYTSPPAGYPGQQYPPPAVGKPSFVNGTVVGRYFGDHHNTYNGPNSKSLSCLAWGLFVLGFFFPLAWLICCLLPCFVKGHPSVRKAAIASSIASIITFIVAAIVLPSILTSSAYRNSSNNNNANINNNNRNFNNNNEFNNNGRKLLF